MFLFNGGMRRLFLKNEFVTCDQQRGKKINNPVQTKTKSVSASCAAAHVAPRSLATKETPCIGLRLSTGQYKYCPEPVPVY